MPINRGNGFRKEIPDLNFMSWLKALAHIIAAYKDADASYFSFLAAMSFVSNVRMMAPVKDGHISVPKSLQQSKGQIDLSELSIEDLDY